ncbi:amidohydrolase (plasmid) [Rhodococcus sp. BH4]|uniref:amidohydrolase family protein n=1 Tax=Rhodococcus sp. BH4 TaxID=1807790 RepID=UPI0009C1E384|nr:amidohydrolase family protein [Rhodococcus sp. BH4]ARE37741.1 amidohydrolase [Rhodococcus sp. BH4]
MSDLVIANCAIEAVAGLDIRIESGRISEIGHNLRRSGNDVLDAEGNDIIPGLCDHHIHLHALAAQRASVDCGPPFVRNSTELAAALNDSTGINGWVRGVGYFESVSGELDRERLDRLHCARPVRIQHRSGALWILNTAGIEVTGLDQANHPGIERDSAGRPTGRIWRADAWLRDRIPGNTPPSLRAVGSELAALGITSVTDATPDLDVDGITAIADAMSKGDLPQRVHLLGAPVSSPSPLEDVSGWATQSTSARLTIGPYKIVLADSGLPDLDELARTITECHRVGRAIAAHSVSRETLLILLAVLNEVGSIPGDRIEHGALIPAASIEEIRRLGLTIVTQPGFIADRGDDYLEHVERADQQDLYRCRSLIDASIPIAFSSDAPYGPLDPWTVIAAAQHRMTPNGIVLGGNETVDAARALDAYLSRSDDPGGPARRVQVGAPADLVLVSGSRRALATIIGGRQVY